MKKSNLNLNRLIVLAAVIGFAVLTGCGGGNEPELTVPGVVTNFTATPGNREVSLSWAAPVNDGGSPIIMYEVTIDDWINIITRTASDDLSYTYTDLDNGTEYIFRVRAINNVGAGPESMQRATPVDDDDSEPEPIPVTGVSLKDSNGLSATILFVGGTETLTATITPSNATNKNLTWISSNPAVASVSTSGLVTALTDGEAHITVTTEDGGHQDSFFVAVYPNFVPENIPENRFEYYWIDEHDSLVTTNGGEFTVAPGETLTITAQETGYTGNQWYLNGINTGQSDESYFFSSSHLGKHIVSLAVEKDEKLYNTNITITVADAPVITITTHPTSQTVTQGSTGSLSVAATVTPSATLSYQWYSNTSNNNTGGTAINGATSSSYSIPTTTTGTRYYFCEVRSAGAASVRSNVATVTVSAAPPALGTQGNPIQLYAGTWANGNINTPGGEQWFKFTAAPALPGYFQYIHFKYGSLRSMYFEVYDTNFNIVTNTWGDTGEYAGYGTGTGGENYRQLYGSIYFIKVIAREQLQGGPPISGTFQIAINASPVAPY